MRRAGAEQWCSGADELRACLWQSGERRAFPLCASCPHVPSAVALPHAPTVARRSGCGGASGGGAVNEFFGIVNLPAWGDSLRSAALPLFVWLSGLATQKASQSSRVKPSHKRLNNAQRSGHVDERGKEKTTRTRQITFSYELIRMLPLCS